MSCRRLSVLKAERRRMLFRIQIIWTASFDPGLPIRNSTWRGRLQAWLGPPVPRGYQGRAEKSPKGHRPGKTVQGGKEHTVTKRSSTNILCVVKNLELGSLMTWDNNALRRERVFWSPSRNWNIPLNTLIIDNDIPCPSILPLKACLYLGVDSFPLPKRTCTFSLWYGDLVIWGDPLHICLKSFLIIHPNGTTGPVFLIYSVS